MTDSPQGVKATERPWKQSDEAMRNALAREIWRYMECPWDFENPDTEMGKLQKQIAIDQAEGLRKVILGNAVFAAALGHKASAVNSHDALVKALEEAKAEGERTARNRDMWKGQVERQAEQIASMRAALEAVRPFMIPGMNWTDEIGQQLKAQVDATLSTS